MAFTLIDYYLDVWGFVPSVLCYSCVKTGYLAWKAQQQANIGNPPAPIIPPPYITDFNPTSGQAGDTITIYGLYLGNTTEVRIGTLACTGLNIVSDNEITAIVPSGTTKNKVTVVNASGTHTSTIHWVASMQIVVNVSRLALTGNTTYYVNSTTGSDSNTGLSASTAFASLGYAVDYLIKTLDFKGFTCTLQLADGFYFGQNIKFIDIVGGGNLSISGNVSNSSLVILDGGDIQTRASLSFSNLTFSNSKISTNGTRGSVGLIINNCIFDSTPSRELIFVGGNSIATISNVTINAATFQVGSLPTCFVSCLGGSVELSGSFTVTGSGSFNSATFLLDNGARMRVSGLTVSNGNNLINKKYIVNNNSTIVSSATLPGSLAGELDATSNYNTEDFKSTTALISLNKSSAIDEVNTKFINLSSVGVKGIKPLAPGNTIYVSTTGSDSNTGFVVGSPIQTNTKLQSILNSYNFNRATIRIELADAGANSSTWRVLGDEITNAGSIDLKNTGFLYTGQFTFKNFYNIPTTGSSRSINLGLTISGQGTIILDNVRSVSGSPLAFNSVTGSTPSLDFRNCHEITLSFAAFFTGTHSKSGALISVGGLCSYFDFDLSNLNNGAVIDTIVSFSDSCNYISLAGNNSRTLNGRLIDATYSNFCAINTAFGAIAPTLPNLYPKIYFDLTQNKIVSAYDNAISGLTSTNIKDAIDELASKLKVYKTAFTQSQINGSNSYVANHQLNSSIVSVTIFNNVGEQITPDRVTVVNPNSVAIDLTQFLPLAGNYSLLIYG